jgi:hypothetical protein
MALGGLSNLNLRSRVQSQLGYDDIVITSISMNTTSQHRRTKPGYGRAKGELGMELGMELVPWGKRLIYQRIYLSGILHYFSP